MLPCRIGISVPFVLLATCLGCGSKVIEQKREREGAAPPQGSTSIAKQDHAADENRRCVDEKFDDLRRRLEIASETNKAERKQIAERSVVVRQELKAANDEVYEEIKARLQKEREANEELSQDLKKSIERGKARIRENEEKLRERRRKKEQEAQEELNNQKRLVEAEANAKAEQERRRKEATRIWTSVKGGQTITAQFLFRIADKVKLKKEDGTELMVSIDDLSDVDRDWITNRAKASSSGGGD